MNLKELIPLGITASKSTRVTRDLTVAHFHDDMPEVYGTPMMIYLMEVAATVAIQPFLPDGWVSVGYGVDIKHLAATPVGMHVTARAEVIDVSEASVTFTVEAHDGTEKIGEGKHIRVPINIERFNRRIKAKDDARKKKEE